MAGRAGSTNEAVEAAQLLFYKQIDERGSQAHEIAVPSPCQGAVVWTNLQLSLHSFFDLQLFWTYSPLLARFLLGQGLISSR